jgi:methanogenic corrinoid protein MtbC1
MVDSDLLTPAEATLRMEANPAAIVSAAIQKHYTLYPDLPARQGPERVQAYHDDAIHYLSLLAGALQSEPSTSYETYIHWVTAFLLPRHAKDDLVELIALIGLEIQIAYGDAVWHTFRPMLDAALTALEATPPVVSPPLPPVLMERYLHALLAGDRTSAQTLILDAFHAGTPLQTLYLEVFQPVLQELGRLWQTGQISVAQVHLATAITQTILATIYVQAPPAAGHGKRVLIACLSNNYHEIGPRMLADFLQLAGYETLFLGANTPEESFLSMVDEQRPDVIALSATLDSHVERIRQTIDIIRSDFPDYRPIIMVGGMAFNQTDGLWKQVGADVWGADARQALENLEGLVSN